MSGGKEPWPIDRTEQLKALIAASVPYAEIGKRMGLSKNAVLGKAHRLGYGAPKPVAAEPVDVCVFPDRGHCLYPIGNPTDSDFRFCGSVINHDGPYCDKHHAICLVPVNANTLKQINFARRQTR